MKTGIVRRVDELGRLAIPREICRSLRIQEGDTYEFAVDGENLVFMPMRTTNDQIIHNIDALLNNLEDVGGAEKEMEFLMKLRKVFEK